MIVAGLSYKEMSLRMTVAEGTLRVRVLRCREKAVAARRELLGERPGNGRNTAVKSSPNKKRRGEYQMNCDESIEFLPWLLNGTLEEGEHDEIRRHLATCERCRAALQETREAWVDLRPAPPQPDPGDPAPMERPRRHRSRVAERHLASCPQCAAELELARMSRRLEEENNVAPFPVARPRSGASSRGWRNAAAAAGLTTLVASAGWIYQVQQTTAYSAQLAQAKNPPAAAAPREGSGAIQKKFGELAATVSQLQSRQEETEMRARKAEAQVAELETRVEAPHASTLVIVDSPVLVRRERSRTLSSPKRCHGQTCKSPFSWGPRRTGRSRAAPGRSRSWTRLERSSVCPKACLPPQLQATTP